MSKAVVVGDLNVGKTCLINRYRMTVCSTVSVCQLEVTVNLTLLFLTQKCPSQLLELRKRCSGLLITNKVQWSLDFFLPELSFRASVLRDL